MENTKEAIMIKALTLFADRGFEGVSVRDIADAVGIKAASIYNHYKSKEDIFNSIIDEMSKRYEEAIEKMQVPHGEAKSVADRYMEGTTESLISICNSIFLYFLNDEFASKFRKMLTIEQFRSTRTGDVFQSFFLDGALEYQKELFHSMIAKGAFKEYDPYVMALQFYAPIFLLLSKYDRLPDRQDEALDTLAKHVKQFCSLYNA
ncbi:MAG: HTH-type transcriptional repressor KstR2 [Firmicutes bacterium ADurb.Bin182]|nr:MAG: HTH-type transcriptional repressor KstR2 [Firmicutes bacterium ADurb.Bin182]